MTLETSATEAEPPAHALPLRIIAAFVQAAALYWTSSAATEPRVWPATNAICFEPILLVSLFVPLIVIGGASAFRPLPLAIWTIVSTIVIALLAIHDATRGRIDAYTFRSSIWPWAQLWFVLPIMLFVSHVLVEDSTTERRWMPNFARHFDTAWKHAVQIIFTVIFVGVFWSILWLGAALFDLLGIKIVQRILGERWFSIPVSTLAVALSIHVTDVRPALIRGIRSLALTLFSWLLPLFAGILLAFLLALPLTTLEPLWRTKFAATVLLSSATLLIFLINSAYGDGEGERTTSRIKRVAANVAAFELAALAALAGWALSLRVGQYGWSAERVAAAAVTMIIACHALGYVVAAIYSPTWLKRLEPTNIIGAYVALALALALFSPLGDPARLMVASQMARLRSGIISADKLDVVALRLDGGRWGRDALEELAARGGDAGARAKQALMAASRDALMGRATPLPSDPASRVIVAPAGREIPPGFLDPAVGPFKTRPFCTNGQAPKCVLRYVNLPADGSEVILFLDTGSATIFKQNASGQWERAASMNGLLGCKAVRDGLAEDNAILGDHAWRDIIVRGYRLTVLPHHETCKP